MTPGLRAITLWRPWPRLILQYGKDIENRPWLTGYRGDLLVHAGQRWDPRALDWAAAVLGRPLPDLADRDLSPTGIVGVVDMTGVCGLRRHADSTCRCSAWAMDRQYHWRWARPRSLPEPVPAVGRQQLWIPDADTLTAVDDQLRRTA